MADIERLTTAGEVELNEAEGDRPGPIVIGLAVAAPAEVGSADAATPEDLATAPAAEAPPPETRVAVIGDADFVANFALGIQGNSDLFLNTMNWLAQQENLVAIRAREPEDRRDHVDGR